MVTSISALTAMTTYQADMRIEYIVEQSSDLSLLTKCHRCCLLRNLDSTTDLGGGMERVVYKTTNSNKYIRVRVKARRRTLPYLSVKISSFLRLLLNGTDWLLQRIA